MASQGRNRAPEDDAFLELPRKMNHIGSSAPCIDASEADGIVWLTAEVPGIPETEIDISLSGDVLTISIDKQNRNAGKRVFFSERSYGQFERSIQLPFAPDPDTVEATIAHGLLTISFPRIASDRTHHIPVSEGRAQPVKKTVDPEDVVTEWPDPAPRTPEPLTVEATATRLV